MLKDSDARSAPKPSFDLEAFLRAFGPGLLFAGAAVGTSHLVLSTRAGAIYGLGLLGVVFFAHLLKYPAFRFGPQYAAATGASLLDGYRRLGFKPLAFYAALTIVFKPFSMAVVTLVLAGILKATFGWTINTVLLCAIIIAIGTVILSVGHYKWLDRINRVFVIVFTLATVAATILALPRIEWSFYPSTAPPMDLTTLLFIAAFIGWMPTSIDVAAWQSLWTLAKIKENNNEVDRKSILLDFNTGYLATCVLAVCFVFMGAGVMHNSGETFADGSAAFASQVIGLYETTLGEWSGPIVSFAAISIMATTCLAVYDGLPRTISATIEALRSDKPLGLDATARDRTPLYYGTLFALAVFAVLILAFLMQSFHTFVQLVTTMSFVSAPIVAAFNHFAMHDKRHVGGADYPKPWLTMWSWVSIALMTVLAIGVVIVALT